MNQTKCESIIRQYQTQVNHLRTQKMQYSEHIARLANIDLDLSCAMSASRVTTEEDDYISDITYDFAYNDGWLTKLDMEQETEYHGYHIKELI